MKLCDWKPTNLELLILFSRLKLGLLLNSLLALNSIYLILIWKYSYASFLFARDVSSNLLLLAILYPKIQLILKSISCSLYSKYYICPLHVPLDHFTISVHARLSSNSQHWSQFCRLPSGCCTHFAHRQKCPEVPRNYTPHFAQSHPLTYDWQVWEDEYLSSLELWQGCAFCITF